MKTAVSIPDSIFHTADRVAERLGMSRSQLYAKAVSQFVEAHRESRVTEELDRVYGQEDSRLDPMLERLQVASLPPEEW